MGVASSAPAPRLEASSATSQAFLTRHRTFIFDCDGVLWHGPEPIAGAAATIEGLRASGRRVLFVTNNSTKARRDYVDAFRDRLGVEVAAEDVVCSSWAAAEYLRQCGDERAEQPRVMCLGMSGLRDELQLAGYEVVGGPEYDDKTYADLEQDLDIHELDDNVGVVVAGLDKHINYYKVAMASAYVKKGCLFVASNTDATLPMKANGTTGPGAGLSCNSVLATVGRAAPDAVAGKPSPLLGATICKTYDLDPASTCMVGDRLDTDMLFAYNAGFSKLLVLSGVCSAEDVDSNADSETQPAFAASSVDVLRQLLEQEKNSEPAADAQDRTTE